MAARSLSSASGSKSVRVTDGRGSGSAAPKSRWTSSAVSWRRSDEVLAPHAAPIGPVDPSDERRDDLAQLFQHHRGVLDGFGQRVGPHAEQQRLERLAAAVDADVRQRRRGQDAPRGVARLGADALLVREVGVGRVFRVTLACPVEELREHRRCRCRRDRRGRRCNATRGRGRRARRGRGSTGTGRRASRRRGCSAWTAPCTTSRDPTRGSS